MLVVNRNQRQGIWVVGKQQNLPKWIDYFHIVVKLHPQQKKKLKVRYNHKNNNKL